MEPRYFYRMSDAKQALVCVRHLEESSRDVGAGVVALQDAQAHTNWYVVADVESLTAPEATLIENILSQRGQRSDVSLTALRRDQKK